MQLKNNAFLQGGKYRIEKVLGQGGFGITYLGIQVALNRKVAIKEFFMKEYCNRDSETSHVSVPSEGSKELVTKFKAKFVKEAQTIAEMENNHIIRIHDVFEENGTAYYVMEYLAGGDLHSRIPKHGMEVDEALAYIRQIGEALGYIHSKNILHLDIKPTNIMFRHSGEAVLIDFGISKHYDDQGGGQTSSTPVGISEGYAPTEQYDREGVSSFSAATDIYSLGATLYCLLNGSRPPKASLVLNEGLPELPATVPASIRQAVEKAMAPRRKDRPQSVGEFLALLTEEEKEATVMVEPVKPQPKPKPTPKPKPNPAPTPDPAPMPASSSWKKWAVPLAVGVVAALAVILWPKGGDDRDTKVEPVAQQVVTPLAASKPVEDTPNKQPAKAEPTQNEPAKSTVVKEEAPAPSLLYVTTSPSGATVYVDGKKVGTSPLSKKEVAAGRHTVKITLDGYETYSKKLTFGEEPVILNEALKEVVKEVPSVQAVSQTASSTASTGTINGHQYVDLGLSVKWADRNVGASSPSDYGSYFAWGETRTKSEYTEENSVTYEKNFGDISGNSQYDAARANWGSSWRLPTKDECQELVDKCKWVWTPQGGHNGYKVTGPNGNSIFLPAAGYRNGSSLDDAGVCGYYWSSTPREYNTQSAYYLTFGSGGHYVYWIYRNLGRSVRPVSE